MTLRNTAYFFISAIGIIFTLIYGKDLLLPFVLGVLFWFMMRGLKSTLEKIPFVKNKFPSWLKTILATGLFIVFIVGLFIILSSNIQHLSQSYSTYQPNVAAIIERINGFFNINITEAVQKQIGNFNFGDLLRIVLNSFSDLLSNVFMIVLYALFILFEESNFQLKLKNLFTDQHQFKFFSETIHKIENSISDYFKLKALVSLITGVFSFFALWLIGIDSPEFWAFLIFILNFIPTIGSLIATVFPAAYSLLQFGEFSPALLVLVIVGVIQLIVGNIIEPRVMGSSMNISPLVTILALTFWGMIWGITGMILSIPIMVVLVIIFSQFESTRPIAILLSEKGEIDNLQP